MKYMVKIKVSGFILTLYVYGSYETSTPILQANRLTVGQLYGNSIPILQTNGLTVGQSFGTSTPIVQTNLLSVGDMTSITLLPSQSQGVFPGAYFRLNRRESQGQHDLFFSSALLGGRHLIHDPALSSCVVDNKVYGIIPTILQTNRLFVRDVINITPTSFASENIFGYLFNAGICEPKLVLQLLSNGWDFEHMAEKCASDQTTISQRPQALKNR